MRLKILLVDDVKMFLELQKMYLRYTTAQIFTANDGATALKIVAQEKPDLILMDLVMSGMDGAECCVRVKTDPASRSIPVVMVTAKGGDTERAICKKAGCDGFLTKPIDRNLYIETVRRFLPAIDSRDARIDYRTRAKFKVFGLTFTGDVVNISKNGLFIAAEYEIEQGTELDISFTLPNSGGFIQAKGRVAWLNVNRSVKKELPVGFGVEMTLLNSEGRRALEQFVEENQTNEPLTSVQTRTFTAL